MGFIKDGLSVLGLCVGIIAVLFIIIMVASFIIDYDPSTTIDENMTVELNGVTVTVPKTDNYSINNSTSLWHVNDTDKFGIDNQHEITEGNAWEYYDGGHGISLYVADSNRTAYSDQEDFSEFTSFDGDSYRTHIEKRNIGDKVIVLYVNEGGNLSKLIIDSARRT